MNASNQPPTPNGTPMAPAGTEMTESFTGVAMARTAETASSAVAAQAKASVEARYIVAIKRPRDIDSVRLAILKECRRPGFAAVARYRKPVGEGIVGPSIRFAETAIRCMTNMLPEVATVYEDAEKRIVRVSVTDLESNVTYSGDVTVEKTVERSTVKEGQSILRSRQNSVGKTTFLVEATEDDLLNKQNALVSKQLRTLALRLLPGDILEDAMAEVIATLEKADAEDPDLARKKMVGVFATFGVKPSDLRDYLGHDLDTITIPEMSELRAVAATLRDGEATWKDTLANKLRTRAEASGAEKAATVKDKVKAKAGGDKAAPPAEKTAEKTPAVVEEQSSLIGNKVDKVEADNDAPFADG